MKPSAGGGKRVGDDVGDAVHRGVRYVLQDNLPVPGNLQGKMSTTVWTGTLDRVTPPWDAVLRDTCGASLP